MKNLKTLREKRNLTQETLSEQLGVERSTIAKWETGVAYPTTDNLKKLADILNCSTDKILGR